MSATPSSTVFRQRVEALARDSAKAAAESQGGGASLTETCTRMMKCVPRPVVYGLIAFVAIWLLLFFLQPKFVTKKEGERYVRDNSKVFFWTIGLSIALWVGLFIWNKYGKPGMFCASK